MADEVGICNSALTKLGAARIVSLGQGGKSANFCAEQYPKIRDRALRRHIWNFAVARQKLAQLATAPVFGPDFAYQLPSDWLRTITVHDNDEGLGGVRYRIEGAKVVSNASDIYLKYVSQVTDPNLMTSDFREMLATMVAVDGVILVVNSNTLKVALNEELRKQLREARSTDAIEDFPQQLPDGTWVTERDTDQSTWDSWAS